MKARAQGCICIINS